MFLRVSTYKSARKNHQKEQPGISGLTAVAGVGPMKSAAIKTLKLHKISLQLK
jgi:hypothetical protein